MHLEQGPKCSINKSSAYQEYMEQKCLVSGKEGQMKSEETGAAGGAGAQEHR